MKTIIAGSRSIVDKRDVVYKLLDEHRKGITEVVCGMALHWLWDTDPNIGGADRFGYDWAKLNKIPVVPFYPDWKRGKSAGLVRNVEMGYYADSALIFWDGRSTGSMHMRDYMKRNKKPWIVHNLGPHYEMILNFDD